MKKKISVSIALLAFLLSFTFALAKDHTAEDRGMAHFNNPAFADGRKSCSTCHPNGRGLKNAGTKTVFFIMGGKQSSLEEAVNVCIINANKGKAIEVDSSQMQEMVSYIKSLGSKPVPGYGK
jgi:cytochrome c